jgi:cytochrome c-type biogenesis protein CcmI
VTAVVLLAAALLTAVAAAGVLAPVLRNRRVDRQPEADPLEDERRGLLRALRDLDDDRATGRLPEESYRDLRTETEARAVAVLKTIERRDGHGDLAADLRELRVPTPTQPRAAGRRALVLAAALALVAVVVAPLLGTALRGRDPGAPITGDVGGRTPVAFFEQRVQDHPDDLAARLDLAEAYLSNRDDRSALDEYLAALKIDPDNVAAHARVGALLFRLGEAEAALAQVDRALVIDPHHPEALYFRGIILQDGLERERSAAEAFHEYLEAAPFGAHRDEVRDRLRDM